MSPKVRYVSGIISESSAIDQSSQNLSAFKIIDQLTINAKTTDLMKSTEEIKRLVVPVNFQLISLWKRQNTSDMGKEVATKLEVELLDPEEKSIQTIQFDLLLPATIIRSRHILNVQGMPVTSSGEYRFQFREIDQKGLKSMPLAGICLDVNVTRE